jgi:hypothetical protein
MAPSANGRPGFAPKSAQGEIFIAQGVIWTGVPLHISVIFPVSCNSTDVSHSIMRHEYGGKERIINQLHKHTDLPHNLRISKPAMYISRNNEAHSYNRCCSVKAINITCCEHVSCIFTFVIGHKIRIFLAPYYTVM